MTKYLLAIALSSLFVSAKAQDVVVTTKFDTSWRKIYRASAPLVNDLVHTKLDVKFDYNKSYLYGKAWITLHPHFYETDSLILDAKGMTINEVALEKDGHRIPLKYTYADTMQLHIGLGKKYKASEKYTIYIDYVSKPNELKVQGSAAITDAKGLYFINPKGEEKDKPTQIWTQGETESNSVWFPTIDKPDQKTTEEIAMTVSAKYVTLSNGKLASQKKNTDGTRTDYWKMDLPHAPYLFFMGVGDFAVVKDTYKGKEVNYYVEHEYEKVARKIFGNTPEMMGFYARILGVEYPWVKYSQMTGRDYVSGAMENTTATLHTDALQQNARQLVDGNKYEEYVAHELFHQWFGDYVTTESWSNLTVNESFANYSEVLWNEHKYGKDAGDAKNYEDMLGYLRSGSEKKDLVRFYYKDKEDMFDAVSYNKGGRILHMLRHYVGDSAFFKSLNLYLNQNKFGTGEAHKLRLAFEQITGQDMNWFFNQWYFGSGNPALDISYAYDANAQKVIVYIAQTQEQNKVFKLPIDIDVYVSGNKKRYSVWMNDKKDIFSFPANTKPDLVNVDGDKILLTTKQDHKTAQEFLYQFTHAGNYLDRLEALVFASQHATDATAKEIVTLGLNDKYKGIRSVAIEVLAPEMADATLLTKIEDMAKNDADRVNRADAIRLLGEFRDKKYEPLFVKGLTDSSYSVAGSSLSALAKINDTLAVSYLPQLKKDARGRLKSATQQLDILTKTDADFDEVYNAYDKADVQDKFGATFQFIPYLVKVNNVANFKKGVDAVIAMRDKYGDYSKEFKDAINTGLKDVATKKTAAKDKAANPADIQKEIDYINTVTK